MESINLTNTLAGLAAIQRAMAGEDILFTKLEIGDGVLTNTDVSGMTGLVNKTKEYPLGAVQAEDSEIVRLRSNISNAGVTQDLIIREYGIYAKFGNEQEFLFAYLNVGESTTPLPNERIGRYELNRDFILYIGNSFEVDFKTNGHLIYVSANQYKYDMGNKANIEENIETLKINKQYKVDDIIEVLGYSFSGDGKSHKRKVQKNDDGTGIKLYNGLYANLIRNTYGVDVDTVEKIKLDLEISKKEVITSERFKENSISAKKLKIATDEDKIKLLNLSDEVIRAIGGNTPVRPEIGDEEVVREKIAKGAIDLSKTDIFFNIDTPNLFDKRKVVLGHIIQGQIVNGENYDSYKTTDGFIEVAQNSKYYSKHIRNISFFDKDKNYINQTVNIIAGVVTEFNTLSAVYVKFSVRIENLNETMFTKDNYPGKYYPEKYLELDEFKLKNQNIPEAEIDQSKLNFIKKTTNLANIKNSISGVISGINIVQSDLYHTTDLIEVEYGKTYSISYARKIQIIGENGNPINEIAPPSPYTDIKFTPAIQVKYIRVSYKKELLDFRMNEGNELKDFEMYGYIMDHLLISENNLIRDTVDDKKMLINFTGNNLLISDNTGLSVKTSMSSGGNGIFNFIETHLNGNLIHLNGDDATPLRTWTTIGANHGYTSVSIINISHDKTNADLGSVWSSNGKEYILLKVENNKLTFGHNYIITEGVVSGDSMLAKDNLTHVRNASNISDINGTFVGGQLYPSINNRSISVCADDIEILNGNFRCNNLKIKEKYNIMDYKGIIDWARNNVGKYYGDNKIPACIEVILTYEFTSAANCIVYTTYNFFNKINLMECGTIQSAALAAVGSRLYRYLPHVKVKNSIDFSNLIDMTDYNQNQYYYKEDLITPELPPTRSIEWLYDEDIKKIGYSIGYIPDKCYSKNSIRKNLTSKIWDLRSSKKNYPVAIGNITINAGESYNFIGYRNYLLPTILTNNTIITIGNEKYIFIDSHDTLDTFVDVKNSNCKEVEILFSDKFTLKTDYVTNEKIFFNIEAKGYAVLKIK